MLHHVSIGVQNVERAALFYDAVLGALGYKRVVEYLPYALAYGESQPTFWVGLPHDQQSASVGNGTHIGFSAKTKDAVHKFHQTALAHGGRDNGAPGPRADYGPAYYGAFVLDVDGNRIEATFHPAAAPAKSKAKSKGTTRAKAAKRPAKAKTTAKKSAKRKARRK